MKKIKMMNMLLGGLLVLGSLTACGGDDSTDTPPTPPEKVVTSVKVDYSATVSQQLLDVATVTVRYIGENGQVAQEQMSSTTWTKSVTIPLPNKAGLNIQPTLNSLKGAVNEGEYTLSANGQATYSWLDQDGQQLKAGSTEKTPDMEAVFYADGLGQYLGAITANCQLARAFAKDYSVSDASITWGGNAGDNSTQGTGISDEGATGDNR
jgi:hypothetical protein